MRRSGSALVQRLVYWVGIGFLVVSVDQRLVYWVGIGFLVVSVGQRLVYWVGMSEKKLRRQWELLLYCFRLSLSCIALCPRYLLVLFTNHGQILWALDQQLVYC